MNNERTVSFYTQGCRLNQSETAVMTQQLKDAGFDIVPYQEPADIVVINTCTVTENGDADARRLVNQINRKNPEVKIAMVGCLAQIQKEKLLALKNVQWVIGNDQKMQLPQIFKSDQRGVLAGKINKLPFVIQEAAVDHTHTRANLKIQDGCDFYCSFCVIPFARGGARSRVYSNLIEDATQMVKSGHQELVLTGVNIGTYGDSGKNFEAVIEGLSKIEGLKRIRVSSIEPTTIPERIFDWMADPQHPLCRHLHIPLQSGSERILKLMARKYSAAEFLDFIQMAKSKVPDLCVGTDVILGFPQEDESSFEETMNFMRSAPIDYAHVFRYSERDYARSKKLGPGADTLMVKDWSAQLRALSHRTQQRFYADQLGKTVQVLFEQGKQGVWQGLTDHYIKVVVTSNQDLKNTIQTVQLTDLNDQVLVGTLSKVSFG